MVRASCQVRGGLHTDAGRVTLLLTGYPRERGVVVAADGAVELGFAIVDPRRVKVADGRRGIHPLPAMLCHRMKTII
jgi:hypothetical protein